MTSFTESYPASAASLRTPDISCGDHHYFIKRSWFGADARVMNSDNAANERPYCQSNPAAQMVAELSVSTDDIWCVETFYISMDRNPIAKSSRLLSLTLGRVFEYDYLWKAGDWVKVDTSTINCASDKESKRQKILD
jgi:hypothetical protein